MASGSFAPAEKQLVEVAPATHTLELTSREAQVLLCLLSHTRDIDPEFPEIKQMLTALKHADAPGYFGILTVLNEDGLSPVHIRMGERLVKA